MNTPKVSIIVGCFNIDKFLKEGRLNDIYAQTYENWELILIDDGSTDETGNILEAEARKDERIIVIHKENEGLSSARNVGLDIVSGEYIWSMDMDDHVEPDCIEYCVKESESRKCDVLMFGFYAITPSLGTKEAIQLKETVISSNEQLCKSFLDRILFVPNGNGFFWNKFYRRSFIEEHHLRFDDLRIQQDEVFNLKVYEHLERCYISPRIFYHYYIYNTGNNRSKFLANRFDIYKSVYNQFRELQSFWKLKDEQFERYLNLRFLNNIGDCLSYNLMHPDSPWNRKEKKEEIYRIMNDRYTLSVMNYCKSQSLDHKSNLRILAYKSKNYFIIYLLYKAFGLFHKLKLFIKP